MGMLKLKAIKLEEKEQFIQEIQEAFKRRILKNMRIGKKQFYLLKILRNHLIL